MTRVARLVHRLARRWRPAALVLALAAAGCMRDEATAPSAAGDAIGDGKIVLPDFVPADSADTGPISSLHS